MEENLKIKNKINWRKIIFVILGFIPLSLIIMHLFGGDSYVESLYKESVLFLISFFSLLFVAILITFLKKPSFKDKVLASLGDNNYFLLIPLAFSLIDLFYLIRESLKYLSIRDTLSFIPIFYEPPFFLLLISFVFFSLVSKKKTIIDKILISIIIGIMIASFLIGVTSYGVEGFLFA